MTTHYEVCTRWVDRLQGNDRKQTKSSNVFAEGDTIFSYGHHFPMAKALRNKDNSVRLILVNGDTFSVTTSRHQSDLRSALGRSGFPTVIIPFSALDAAGVEHDSVELIEATADRNDQTDHVAYEQPEKAVWKTEPVHAYVALTPEEIQAIVDDRNTKAMEQWEMRHRWAFEHVAGLKTTGAYWAKWVENDSVREYPREFTADRLRPDEKTAWRQTGTKRVLYRSPISRHAINVSTDDDGRVVYRWTTYKHWLGESVIRANVAFQTITTCRTCKGSGLGIGPQHEDRWLRLRCDSCGGAGRFWKSRTRTTVFMSGFDHQEPRPLYFFCELPPKSNPTTVAEAYEMLKPDTVKLAEQMNRNVVRQGDIFAVALHDVKKADLTKQGATYAKRGVLLGTNHVATEVASLPDGTTLARGTLVHAPDFRRPDHVRKTLGKQWHVIVKNTVPVSA